MSDLADRAKYILSRPLTKVIAIGLLIRILLVPVALMYDTNFWTIVIRNMEAGYGLYNLEGYYYTPVWGYMLGFVSGVQNLIFDIGDLSTVCYPFYEFRSATLYAYSPNASSIVFLFLLKCVLTMSDLLIATVAYKLVKERTGDYKKAVLAFGLTFLCPVVLGASGVIVMPDTISAAFTLLTIMLVKRDRPLIAGFCYSFAVWTKFFPIAICLLLICYIFARHKDDIRTAWKQTGLALAGFFSMSVVIYIPQIMEGTIGRTFSFLTDRLEFLLSGSIFVWIGSLIFAALIIYIFVLVGRHMCRSEKNIDDTFMEYCLLTLAVCMIAFTNVQYFVTLIPFLVYCLIIKREAYKWVWLALAITGVFTIFTLNTNATMLISLSYYAGIFSVDQVMSLFHFFNDYIIGDLTLTNAISGVSNWAMKMSIVAIVLIFALTRLIPKIKNRKKVRTDE